MPKRKLAILALLLTTAIWGISGPVIKLTLRYTSPFTFLFFRFLIASFVIFPFFAKEQKRRPLSSSDLLRLTVLSLFGQTLTLSFVFLGFARTTALEGTLLSSLSPIFIITGGVIFLGETINKLERLGLVSIIIGSIITVLDPVLDLKNVETVNLLGNLLIISSGITWAIFSLRSKELFNKYSPFIITAYSFFVGLATFTPVALGEFFLAPTAKFVLPNALPGILYLAIFSSLSAVYMYEVGLKYIDASEAAVFSYLQPVFALPISVLFLKENITLPFLVGGGIIAFGVIISNRGATLQRTSLRRHKL